MMAITMELRIWTSCRFIRIIVSTCLVLLGYFHRCRFLVTHVVSYVALWLAQFWVIMFVSVGFGTIGAQSKTLIICINPRDSLLLRVFLLGCTITYIRRRNPSFYYLVYICSYMFFYPSSPIPGFFLVNVIVLSLGSIHVDSVLGCSHGVMRVGGFRLLVTHVVSYVMAFWLTLIAHILTLLTTFVGHLIWVRAICWLSPVCIHVNTVYTLLSISETPILTLLIWITWENYIPVR